MNMMWHMSYIKENSSIKLNKDNEFKITTDMNCESSNLIYCISSNGRNSKYVGQTGDTVRSRVRVHKEQIAHKEFRMLGMSQHISLCCRNTPFYKVKKESEDLRKIMEEHFIKKYKPKLNNLPLSMLANCSA